MGTGNGIVGGVPNQHQAQGAGVLSIDILLCVAQQDVHVRVDALQGALVLGLAPLQTNDELGADSEYRIGQ